MVIKFVRLDTEITRAVENPEQFDFSTFFERSSCGTTACLAGNLALHYGWAPVWDDAFDETANVVRDGKVRYVKHVAAELLGLTESQATQLFVTSGGLHGIIRVRNEWARAAGVPERTWDVPAGVS